MQDRIKILFTIPNFDTAGSGIPLLKVATRLDKSIFEPQIACLHRRGNLFKDVKASGIKVHIIDLYINARPIYKMLSDCYKLSKIFRDIKPDIIHSYHYADDYTEPIASKIAGIKWVYTKKNMSWKGPSYRGWKLRSFLSNGIICQNKDMLKYFFNNSKKAILIPIGVDINEFKSQTPKLETFKRWGLPDDALLIITVSNFVPVKGIEILIQAFEELAPDYPEWRLMIVGDDTTQYGVELKKYLTSEILKERVIFTGKQKNVRELLDISEIYVQPTLNKGRMEGAPIAIQEAMANGKVIIGSNIPGIRDQLECFPDHLFKAGDVFELRKKLSQFISNDKSKNNEIGRRFVRHVNKHYDLSIEKKNLEMFYQNLIT